MEIREYTEYNEKEIVRLYTEVGWTAYTDNLSILRKGFENSLLVLGAYENNELAGIIRVVGDGFTIVFVQDILVFPGQQIWGTLQRPWKELEGLCSRKYLTVIRMSVRLSWQQTILRRQLLFINQWALVSFLNLAAAVL